MESAHQQRSVAQPSSSTRSPRFFPNSASTQRPLRLFTLSLEGSVILCPKSTKTATLTTFRINTCKSVSKQRTLTPFRMNTYKKTGGRGYARQRNQQLPCSQLSQRPSYAPRSGSIPCVLTRLRILPVATGVCSFELPASSVSASRISGDRRRIVRGRCCRRSFWRRRRALGFGRGNTAGCRCRRSRRPCCA